jgi:hypothetical protein
MGHGLIMESNEEGFSRGTDGFLAGGYCLVNPTGVSVGIEIGDVIRCRGRMID